MNYYFFLILLLFFKIQNGIKQSIISLTKPFTQKIIDFPKKHIDLNSLAIKFPPELKKHSRLIACNLITTVAQQKPSMQTNFDTYLKMVNAIRAIFCNYKIIEEKYVQVQMTKNPKSKHSICIFIGQEKSSDKKIIINENSIAVLMVLWKISFITAKMLLLLALDKDYNTIKCQNGVKSFNSLLGMNLFKPDGTRDPEVLGNLETQISSAPRSSIKEIMQKRMLGYAQKIGSTKERKRAHAVQYELWLMTQPEKRNATNYELFRNRAFWEFCLATEINCPGFFYPSEVF